MLAQAPSTPPDTRACCRQSVLEDPDSSFCMECGKPLLRCMAFSECGGILDSEGQCAVCVEPHLIIIPGATMNAPIGGSVAVPFNLFNGSQVDRPLFVRGVWIREKGDWREERLGWEKLGSRRHAPASVTACEFDRAGLHEIEIMFAVATRWRTREECYAFSTRVRLDIAGEKDNAGPTIQITSDNQMNGNIFQFKDREPQAGDAGKVVDAIDMNIQRLDREERSLGLRGMEGGVRCPRSAVFEFHGFAGLDPEQSALPIVTTNAMLAFGRADYKSAGGTSDVRLLAYGAAGHVDEQLSAPISRKHFNLYIENDRPVLRVEGRNGLRVNGKAYGQEKHVLLSDGDVIEPLIQHPEALQLHFRFRRELEKVSRIIVTRKPAEPRGGSA